MSWKGVQALQSSRHGPWRSVRAQGRDRGSRWHQPADGTRRQSAEQRARLPWNPSVCLGAVGGQLCRSRNLVPASPGSSAVGHSQRGAHDCVVAPVACPPCPARLPGAPKHAIPCGRRPCVHISCSLLLPSPQSGQAACRAGGAGPGQEGCPGLRPGGRARACRQHQRQIRSSVGAHAAAERIGRRLGAVAGASAGNLAWRRMLGAVLGGPGAPALLPCLPPPPRSWTCALTRSWRPCTPSCTAPVPSAPWSSPWSGRRSRPCCSSAAEPPSCTRRAPPQPRPRHGHPPPPGCSTMCRGAGAAAAGPGREQQGCSMR